MLQLVPALQMVVNWSLASITSDGWRRVPEWREGWALTRGRGTSPLRPAAASPGTRSPPKSSSKEDLEKQEDKAEGGVSKDDCGQEGGEGTVEDMGSGSGRKTDRRQFWGKRNK